MYYGELAKHSEEYQTGHSTGSSRAYSDAITRFKVLAQEDAKKRYTAAEVADMLKSMKDGWIEYCDTFGHGK